MTENYILELAVGVIGVLISIILAYQKKMNSKVENMSMQLPVVLEKITEMKSEIGQINISIASINTLISTIEKDLIKLRERSHQINNDLQKSFIAIHKEISEAKSLSTERIAELKSLLAVKTEKLSESETELLKLKLEVENLGKVIKR